VYEIAEVAQIEAGRDRARTSRSSARHSLQKAVLIWVEGSTFMMFSVPHSGHIILTSEFMVFQRVFEFYSRRFWGLVYHTSARAFNSL